MPLAGRGPSARDSGVGRGGAGLAADAGPLPGDHRARTARARPPACWGRCWRRRDSRWWWPATSGRRSARWSPTLGAVALGGGGAVQLPAGDDRDLPAARGGRSSTWRRTTWTGTRTWTDYYAAKARIFLNQTAEDCRRPERRRSADPGRGRAGSGRSRASSAGRGRWATAPSCGTAGWSSGGTGGRSAVCAGRGDPHPGAAQPGERPGRRRRGGGDRGAAGGHRRRPSGASRACRTGWSWWPSGGVRYINDSKGTNVGAVVKSLEGFAGGVILIAGGKDKGGDFAPLRPLVAARVKALLLLGQARAGDPRTSSGAPVRWRTVSTLEAAVARGAETAQRRATPCCCRRPAPASTCSGTSSIAATCSAQAVRDLAARRGSGWTGALSVGPADGGSQPPPGRAGRGAARPAADARLAGAPAGPAAAGGAQGGSVAPGHHGRPGGLGIVMIYSASAIRAQERFGDPTFFLKKQAVWACARPPGHGCGPSPGTSSGCSGSRPSCFCWACSCCSWCWCRAWG